MIDWALSQKVPTAKKLLLVGLAWIADDCGVTFRSQKAIADRLGKDSRWVGEHIGELESQGFITRFRRHRANGSRTTDLIVLNGPRTEDLDLSLYSGILDAPIGGNAGEPIGGNAEAYRRKSVPLTAETGPPRSNSLDNTPSPKKEQRVRADVPPEGFPDHLRPHARVVLPLLREVAAQHQAKAVSAAGLGRMMMGRPRKPFVKAAHDFAAWAEDPPRQIRDVLGTYRRWLDNESDLEGGEKLDEDGHPAGMTARQGGRRGGKDSASDLIRRLRDGKRE